MFDWGGPRTGGPPAFGIDDDPPAKQPPLQHVQARGPHCAAWPDLFSLEPPARVAGKQQRPRVKFYMCAADVCTNRHGLSERHRIIVPRVVQFDQITPPKCLVSLCVFWRAPTATGNVVYSGPRKQITEHFVGIGLPPLAGQPLRSLTNSPLLPVRSSSALQALPPPRGNGGARRLQNGYSPAEYLLDLVAPPIPRHDASSSSSPDLAGANEGPTTDLPSLPTSNHRRFTRIRGLVERRLRQLSCSAARLPGG